MPPVISIENVCKSYRLGTIGSGTLREDLQSWWHRVRGRPDPNLRLDQAHLPVEGHVLWALQDVSLEVQQGEVLGIIGRNGAGKSTLLKILSRVTAPTSGRIRVKGRVASLLEVGTGFHPELTGRENVYLNGAILGMTRAEVARKFDEIVAFSEIEQFIDTPVKRYSSGMYVRLAFAVAAHLDPEILVVDEVLAVGDMAFQKKCLGKMGDVAGAGRTVLFVSHNMTAIKTLCHRAILLRGGQLVADAEAERVVGEYAHSHLTSGLVKNWDDIKQAPGNEKIRIIGIQAIIDDPAKNALDVDTPFRIQFDVINHLDGAVLNLSVVFYTSEDICVFNTTSPLRACAAGFLRGECFIPGGFLNDEIYRVRLLVVQDGTTPLFDDNNIFSFEVAERFREGGWFGKWVGIVRPSLKWEWGPAVSSLQC